MAISEQGAPARRSWRSAKALVLVALALLGMQLFKKARTGQEVAFKFGPAGREVAGARVDYLYVGNDRQDDADTVALTWEFGPSGAPEEKRHRPMLLPGPYRVGIRLRMLDGSWRSGETDIEAGAPGRVVIEVPDVVAAGATPSVAPEADAGSALASDGAADSRASDGAGVL